MTMFWLERGPAKHSGALSHAHHPVVVKEDPKPVAALPPQSVGTPATKVGNTTDREGETEQDAFANRTESERRWPSLSLSSSSSTMPMTNVPQETLSEDQDDEKPAQPQQRQLDQTDLQQLREQNQDLVLLVESLRREMEQERSKRREAETQKKKQEGQASANKPPTTNTNVVILSQKQYAGLQTELAGFRHLVDVLTGGKPALRAAESAVPLSLHPAVAMPVHVVRLLEYMPYHAKSLHYAITTERVYEWQVYNKNKSDSWHATARHFPDFFGALPVRTPYSTMNQLEEQPWNKPSHRHKRSKLEEEDDADMPMFRDPSSVVVTNEGLSYRYDLSNGYPLPQNSLSALSLKGDHEQNNSTGTPTWKWLGDWHVDVPLVHSTNANPFDEHGWSYALEAAHFLQVNKEATNTANSQNVSTKKRKKKKTRKQSTPPPPPPIQATPEQLLATASTTGSLVRRRVWVRRRILVDYPMASEATKHYLELLITKEQATMAAATLAAEVASSQTTSRVEEEGHVQKRVKKKDEDEPRGEVRQHETNVEAAPDNAPTLTSSTSQTKQDLAAFLSVEESQAKDASKTGTVQVPKDRVKTEDLGARSDQSEPGWKEQEDKASTPAEQTIDSNVTFREKDEERELVDKQGHAGLESQGAKTSTIHHKTGHDTTKVEEPRSSSDSTPTNDDDASSSKDSCSSRYHDPLTFFDMVVKSTSPPISPVDPPKTIILDLRNLLSNLVGSNNTIKPETKQSKHITGEEEVFQPTSLLGHKLTLEDAAGAPPGVAICPEDYSCCSSTIRDDDESSILSTTPPPASAFPMKLPMTEPPASSSRASFKASTIATVEEEEQIDLSSHSTGPAITAFTATSTDTPHSLSVPNKWKLWGK